MQDRWQAYRALMRIDKPIGWLLLLWPSMWGLWFAGSGRPQPLILVIFVLGVFIMRAAGCIINDLCDRHFDGHVKRTRLRPLASGQIKVYEALLLAGVLILVAFGLVLLTNSLTLYLAMIGLVLTCVYPLMKRYIHLPQAVLGLAFGWGIPMAYAALQNRLPWSAWYLFLVCALWTIAYDTEYAMSDRDDDLRLGLKSSAIWFGRRDKLIIGCLQITVLVLLTCFGLLLNLTLWYYAGLLGALLLFTYQQYLIRERQPNACLQAFKNNHYVGLSIFIGIFLHFLA